MTLEQVLQECADRNGVSLEPGTIRERQVAQWISEFGEVTETAAGFLSDQLRKLDSWPRYGEIRSALSYAKSKANSAWHTSGEVCTACRGTGWVPWVAHDGAPCASACRCPLGDKIPAVRIDAGVFQRRLNDLNEPDHPESTPERRQAALAYIAKSFQRDPEPILMVEAILSGQRDDVVRSMTR